MKRTAGSITEDVRAVKWFYEDPAWAKDFENTSKSESVLERNSGKKLTCLTTV